METGGKFSALYSEQKVIFDIVCVYNLEGRLVCRPPVDQSTHFLSDSGKSLPELV